MNCTPKNKIKASEFRLEKLVETYLDEDIPKELHLKKKDKLMREILALKEEKKDFKQRGNNWIETLTELDFRYKTSQFFDIIQQFQRNCFLRQKSWNEP